MEVRDYLDGRLVNVATEHEKESIIVDFNQTNAQGTISQDSATLVNEAAIAVIKYINDGIGGGSPGISEGLEYRREIAYQGETIEIFDGYLDFRKDYEEISPVEVRVGLTELNSKDNLDTLMSGVSLSAMLKEEIITTADLVKLKYVKQSPEDTLGTLIAIGQTYLFAMQVAQLTKETAKDIGNALGVTASGTTGSLGATIMQILGIIANLIFLAIALSNLIKYLDETINKLYPALKDYYGIGIKNVLEKFLKEYDITLETNIEDFDKFVYLPSGKNNNKDPFKPGDYGYTINEQFQNVLNMFEADTAINGNKLYLNAKNDPSWEKNSTYTLPDVLNEKKRYNTDEIYQSILIDFRTDPVDVWTTEEFEAAAYEVKINPKVINNRKMLLNRGSHVSGFELALASRKGNRLSGLEEAVKAMAKAGDTLIKAFGGKPKFASKIVTRSGAMKISEDEFSVPKVAIVQGGFIPSNHLDILSAQVLWEKYHNIKSMARTENQKSLLPQDWDVPFNFNSFKKIVLNSHCNTKQGEKAKLTSVEWFYGLNRANINGYVKEVYTNNLEESII